ncbi:MAG: thioredoxin [Conexivisphaerales archaeon]
MNFDNEEESIKEQMLKRLISSSNAKVSSLSEPVIVTDLDFNQFVSSHENVVIDCWAEWCQPCRLISPIVEELARKYTGKIWFGKLNVDENQSTAMEYSIMGIPTLLIFKNGSLVDQVVGAMPKRLIEAKVLSALGIEV